MTKPAKDVVKDPISTDLKKVMRQLKLSPMLDTLPDRLALARHQHLSHAAFLELVLADEATRRDTTSAARRARAAGLDSPRHCSRPHCGAPTNPDSDAAC